MTLERHLKEIFSEIMCRKDFSFVTIVSCYAIACDAVKEREREDEAKQYSRDTMNVMLRAHFTSLASLAMYSVP